MTTNDIATPTSDGLTDDQLVVVEQLAIRKAKLRDEKTSIDEEIAAIDTQLRALLPDGTTQAGQLKVIVTVPARLDTKKLAEAFGPAQHPVLYRAAIDTAAVKEHMSPAQLRPFQVAGARTVTVR
ncbi:hypothetical protein GCM10025864_44800 [Luteimicrobium album]|uniref:Uncharacterized protein n=1 Tax=Luteimicrobium album TaxID=1054550 RepID=A0ABQ6IAE3_9MICO|nr:hypothetical protein [Luteimicrobium album]GMA22254.1 hypothetical protein GCM10025864_00130 [Luteimicrobium album]GMA26659.1 hypothetical protein GCM10025864_44180 [Luteimicrobium album]GMA26721.1 hypothetical protein GCM10025864_44800 [Luteimicrobium album]